MSYPVDAVPYRTGIAISVEVVGQAEPGPQYQPVPQSEPDDQSQQLTASSPASQSPAASAPVAGQPYPDTSSGGYPAWLWFVIAAVVVGASAGGVAVVWRRSRPTK
jgi:hypothetical protein